MEILVSAKGFAKNKTMSEKLLLADCLIILCTVVRKNPRSRQPVKTCFHWDSLVEKYKCVLVHVPFNHLASLARR